MTKVQLNNKSNTIKIVDGKQQSIKVVNRRQNLNLSHTGKTGVGIVSITKTSTDGLIDTYTIIYNDNTSSTFTVTNGQSGIKGDTPYIQSGNWYIDGVDTGVKAGGVDGVGVPNGGQTGQILAKASNADYNTSWIDVDNRFNDKNSITEFTVSDSVNVSHGLNKLVSVTVINSANDEVLGEVKYIDLNNIIVSFSAPFSGKIICN